MFPHLRFLLLSCVVVAVAGCAVSTSYMRPAKEALHPTGDKALVRFLRPSKFQGGGRTFAILDGETAIGNAQNDKQFDYVCTPGRHRFIAVAAGIEPSFLEATVESGKTYYVIVTIEVGFTSARTRLIPVNRNSEYWEKVDEYEKSLQRLEPEGEALRLWQEKNTLQIKQLVKQVESDYEYQSKYKQEYQSKLVPEDGR